LLKSKVSKIKIQFCQNLEKICSLGLKSQKLFSIFPHKILTKSLTQNMYSQNISEHEGKINIVLTAAFLKIPKKHPCKLNGTLDENQNHH
jgi:hypothetical protein